MTRRVAVVAHTHWDREWYAPYEYFRVRLVEVLDEVLGLLEADPSFRCFLLDGQMAMVDDYLEVRPEAAGRIRRLAEQGRLALGPWYVLMDEFCVSAETIVRNLQLGLRRAESFGGSIPVGYLPDMFGHAGQMPQLLRLAGLEHAVVWRGVPATVDRTAFWWAAPDGSTVRAEYLPVGYANGAYLPADPEALVRRLAAHEAELGPLLAGDSTPILLMNGTDHQRPQPHLPGLLAAANRLQDHFDFQQVSLAEYLAAASTDQLPRWRGELRSAARANLLMGVLSNRVDLKAAAAVAERRLERWAEPLATLWLPPERWPADLLAEAWLAMVRNAAHDSICGCSADAVGRAVRHRYDVAAALADEVIDQALALAQLATDTAGPVVINPAATSADATVELVLAGTEPVPNTQVLAGIPAGVEERIGTGADFGRLLGELRASGWLAAGHGVDARIHRPAGGLEVVIVADASRRASPGWRRSWPRPGPRPALAATIHCASASSAGRHNGSRPGSPGCPAMGGLPFARPPWAPKPYRAGRPGWRTPSCGSTSSKTTAPFRSTARPAWAAWSMMARREIPTTTPRLAATPWCSIRTGSSSKRSNPDRCGPRCG